MPSLTRQSDLRASCALPPDYTSVKIECNFPPCVRNKASFSRTAEEEERLTRAMVSTKSYLTEATLICPDDLNEEIVSCSRLLCRADFHLHAIDQAQTLESKPQHFLINEILLLKCVISGPYGC